jgi:hypothetical protein
MNRFCLEVRGVGGRGWGQGVGGPGGAPATGGKMTQTMYAHVTK